MHFPATKPNRNENPTVLSTRTNIKRANTSSTHWSKNWIRTSNCEWGQFHRSWQCSIWATHPSWVLLYPFERLERNKRQNNLVKL